MALSDETKGLYFVSQPGRSGEHRGDSLVVTTGDAVVAAGSRGEMLGSMVQYVKPKMGGQ